MSTSRARVLLVVAVLAVTVAALLAGRALGPLLEDGTTRSAPATTATPPPGVPGDAQPAVVDRIVDGDTLRVAVSEPGPIPPTGSAPVRLLTIDAPESVHPERDVECGGPEASDRLAALVPPGTTVWLASDVSDTDRFDRYLRVVFTDDGRSVNETLVAEGHARAVRYPPDEAWYPTLRVAEDAAREAGRGAWSRCGW